MGCLASLWAHGALSVQSHDSSTRNLCAGPVEYRHAYVDMSSVVVEASNITRPGSTCRPAMGISFAAGTTDGACVRPDERTPSRSPSHVHTVQRTQERLRVCSGFGGELS